jgi:hypothetical protein
LPAPPKYRPDGRPIAETPLPPAANFRYVIVHVNDDDEMSPILVRTSNGQDGYMVYKGLSVARNASYGIEALQPELTDQIHVYDRQYETVL